MPHARARQGVFPPELRAQATAMACSLPSEQGVALARWSRAELVKQLAAQPALAAVSTGTLGRWLRSEQIRPWRYRMWQHIHDPTAFLARAGPILQLYSQASSLLRSGTWLVCVDEKTSIQAREAEQPPRGATRRHPRHQSPRYTRRGSRQLIAGLSVADGHILGRCTARKRFVDFQSFISAVLVPEAKRRNMHTIGLILDNGTTHAPKQLQRWLAEQAAKHDWGVRFEVHWLPANASWLDQIEIWFSILQRKLLQPNHFVSVAALEQAIANFIARYNQTAKPIKWTYTVEKLERKLGTHL
jgi:DDE superfamily endonuclease